jgi:adenine phosphoribosyltransferase
VNCGEFDLYKLIRNYLNFPKEGILFRDVNPIFRDSAALKCICDLFLRTLQRYQIDIVAGIESRGFILATALGLKLNKGIILIRKAGKLPGLTIRKSYNIEYGSAIMEIQKDAVTSGEMVLVADDLIATGGTAAVSAQLIEQLGGRIAAFAFLVDLAYLQGSKELRSKGYNIHSLAVYDQ